MTIKFDRNKCTECNECDKHYRDIRGVARVYDGLDFPGATWQMVGGMMQQAVASCQYGALTLKN